MSTMEENQRFCIGKPNEVNRQYGMDNEMMEDKEVVFNPKCCTRDIMDPFQDKILFNKCQAHIDTWS